MLVVVVEGNEDRAWLPSDDDGGGDDDEEEDDDTDFQIHWMSRV